MQQTCALPSIFDLVPQTTFSKIPEREVAGASEFEEILSRVFDTGDSSRIVERTGTSEQTRSSQRTEKQTENEVQRADRVDKNISDKDNGAEEPDGKIDENEAVQSKDSNAESSDDGDVEQDTEEAAKEETDGSDEKNESGGEDRKTQEESTGEGGEQGSTIGNTNSTQLSIDGIPTDDANINTQAVEQTSGQAGPSESQDPAVSVTEQNPTLVEGNQQLTAENIEAGETREETAAPTSTQNSTEQTSVETPEKATKLPEQIETPGKTTKHPEQTDAVSDKPTATEGKSKPDTEVPPQVDKTVNTPGDTRTIGGNGWSADRLVEINESRLQAARTNNVELNEQFSPDKSTETGQFTQIQMPKEVQINVSLNGDSNMDMNSETGTPKEEIRNSFEIISSVNADKATAENTRFQSIASSDGRTQTPPEIDQAVASQIIKGTLKILQQGKNELRLQLRPPELGEVRIELTLENNVMTARIIVSSENVRTIIERQLQNLRNAIAEEGVNIEKFDVLVGQEKEQTNENGPGQGGKGPSTQENGYSDNTTTNQVAASVSWDINSVKGENSIIHLIA